VLDELKKGGLDAVVRKFSLYGTTYIEVTLPPLVVPELRDVEVASESQLVETK
jgi:hypothetical protein